MMDPVDILISVSEDNAVNMAATLGSAITQTCAMETPVPLSHKRSVRVILFLDRVNPFVETLLDRFWYNRKGTSRGSLSCIFCRVTQYPLFKEDCSRGVVIRNYSHVENLDVAKQWYFEWPGKSEMVKFLEPGEILIPESIRFMLRYLREESDGVISPLIKSVSNRFKGVHREGDLTRSLLLKRTAIERMVSEGFIWRSKTSLSEHFEKFKYEFSSTKEFNFLHCSMI